LILYTFKIWNPLSKKLMVIRSIKKAPILVDKGFVFNEYPLDL
jgi:hypothetical protein